jgi:hypothetical protein
MSPRRKPIILTRRVLHQIWRMKRNGGTALSISGSLDAPYDQILRVLHPHLNFSEKIVVPSATAKRNPFPRQVA